MNKNIFFGYYGYDNFGDDVMLMVLDAISEDNSLIFTSSPVKNKLKLKSEEFVFNSFHRDLFSLIINNKRIVWGGGTCFYSNNRNLIMLLLVSLYSFFLRKRIIFFSVGVGKLNTKLDKIIVKMVIYLSEKVFVRDDSSYRKLRLFSSNKITKVSDLFLLAKSELNLSNHNKDNSNILFNLSADCVQDINSELFLSYIEDIERKTGLDVKFISLQNVESSPENSFYSKHKSVCDSRLIEGGSIQNIYSEIISCKLFIGFRLHGLIPALLNNCKVLAYPYSPKVSRMLKELLCNGDSITLQMGVLPDIQAIMSALDDDIFLDKSFQSEVKNTRMLLDEIINK